MAIIRSNQTAGQYFLLALLLKTYWVLFGLLFCSPFFCFIFVRLLSHLCFTARTFYSGPHCALLAMQTAVIATGCLFVRPSVRPSVTFRCFVQTNEDTIVRFSASGSTILLVSEKVKFICIFAGDHLQRGR